MIFKKSNSYEEFCQNHPCTDGEWYIGTMQGKPVQVPAKGLQRGPCDKYLLSNKDDAEAILALIQLKRLREEWTDNWEPNWWNSKQKKYIIRNYYDHYHITAVVKGTSVLYFKTEGQARKFLETFRELIDIAQMWL